MYPHALAISELLCTISELLRVNILLRIINVLPLREFHSPKSQFMKYQCLFSRYY